MQSALIDPFQVDISTVVATSPMLGHYLEDRLSIREAQESDLLAAIDQASSLELENNSEARSFVVAPLDVLVSRTPRGLQFHVIEMNGTGIGGVSNLPAPVLRAVLSSTQQAVAAIARPDSVVLLPVSGKEDEANPRLNKLMQEKLVFAQALATGLRQATGSSEIVTVTGLNSGRQSFSGDCPAVVVGYMKELLQACRVDGRGQLRLAERPVVGAFNDRFCLNLLSQFPTLDLEQFQPINGTFLPGGDKGVAYSLLDKYLICEPSAMFPAGVHHAHAYSLAELIATVQHWLEQGRRPVIKPHGTGLGHGIEFFLNPAEPRESICQRIQRAVVSTRALYGTPDGAFPYTICDYVEATTVDAVSHRFHGHKFELRVVVYRDGDRLRTCPTIAKVAVAPFDPERPCRDSLINNITNASTLHQKHGTEQMLPLCSHQTLELLGIRIDELAELCRVATAYLQLAIREIPHQHMQVRRLLAGQPMLPRVSSVGWPLAAQSCR